MCKWCSSDSCLCNGCIAVRGGKACPICHHLRSFYVVRVKAIAL